ncbi:hypothetical protein, partial [uncultured Duncaniella sp.]|uniref:hypothetical protein n=1 Tax=uncultured Duncaniella sp. TaxID=2768039 RepID=UPI0025B039E0
PVASVHPEPGSNSPLFSIVLFSSSFQLNDATEIVCCLLLSLDGGSPDLWTLTYMDSCRIDLRTSSLPGIGAVMTLVLLSNLSIVILFNVLCSRFRKLTGELLRNVLQSYCEIFIPANFSMFLTFF